MASHNGHDIVVIDDEKQKETRKEAEEVAKDYIKKVELKLEDFEQNLKYVTAIEKRKTEKLATLKTDINNTVDSTIARLEARRSELLTEVEEIYTKALKELWAHKEHHESSIFSMKSALSFAEQSLQHKEDMETISLCTQATARLRQLNQLDWDSQSTEIIEASDREWEGI